MHLLPSKISVACASMPFRHHCFAPPPNRLAIKLAVLVAPSLLAWISPLCTTHFSFFFVFDSALSHSFFAFFLCMLLSFHRCRCWGTLIISATIVSGRTLGCSSSPSEELEESPESWSLFLFLLRSSFSPLLLATLSPPSRRVIGVRWRRRGWGGPRVLQTTLLLSPVTHFYRFLHLIFWLTRKLFFIQIFLFF